MNASPAMDMKTITIRTSPMKLLQILSLGMAILTPCPQIARADDSKNHDKDVVYDEAKVPPYDLPPLLLSSEGKAITTPEEWFNVRRPQLMALFGNLVYGVVPKPESPIRTTFEVVKTNPQFMQGKATRKDVRIHFENRNGSAEIRILVFTTIRGNLSQRPPLGPPNRSTPAHTGHPPSASIRANCG